ncbi:hypothetical protein [Pelomonas sp. KK5]|uniref:hypothetical protein n=1 Tax=Pelomonas sp. KK5 TaxID=1855730 RepID=UPI00097BEDE9|nr:hypothetical protein [Pelomonas sp. KK5]
MAFAHDANAQIPQHLEQPLVAVEGCLNLLGEALQRRDAAAIESHAADLQVALQQAIGSFSDAARNGGVPAGLRSRLVQAGGKVAAQRESLARATASLDRAMDVLMPGVNTGFYSAVGKNERRSAMGGAFFQA